MTIIDIKTRQTEQSPPASVLQEENEYLRSQLQAEKLMRLQRIAPEQRKKHPWYIVLGLWSLAAFYLLDAALRLILLIR